ncbi:hydantoinase/oxoprolinase N-terminal domain-containing protein [Paenibacillus sp. GCM10012306]|uniref:hydantoinase/oxoprolinase N-terminal domain-containing protein n=1 Tax=Paenibacillus sp. GCM10012306 TaxID=3317342 RepID=UPI00361D5BE3
MRMGIDVGSTYTAAVIISESGRLLGQAKSRTTADILSGIRTVIGQLLAENGIEPQQVKGIFIGTTHLLNVLSHGQGIADTALIRICKPSKIHYGLGWPPALLEHVKWMEQIPGGFDFTGRKLSGENDQPELDRLIRRLVESGVGAVAIVGTFAPLYEEEEQRMATLLREALPQLSISLSHQIGSVGFLERENATLINAMLSQVMRDSIQQLSGLFGEAQLHCPYWFTQNDGSILSLDRAAAFPGFAVASGIANSLRGSAYLTGIPDCIVVDMGGSKTEVGLVIGGEPQEHIKSARLLGIRVNLRLPKVVTLPFGGETPVYIRDGEITVGHDWPVSGSEAGQANPEHLKGEPLEAAAGSLTEAFLRRLPEEHPLRREYGKPLGHWREADAEQVVRRTIATLRETIEQLQTARDKLPVVLVGGGSALLKEKLFYKYGELVQPPAFQLCTAVGACVAPVGVQLDRICWLQNETKEAALQKVKQEAIQQLLQDGALEDSISFVQMEEIPFDYYSGEVIRFRIRAVGQLKL